MADARSEGSASRSQHAHLPDRVVARGGAVHVHRASVLLAAAVAQGGGGEPSLPSHFAPPVRPAAGRRDPPRSPAAEPLPFRAPPLLRFDALRPCRPSAVAA